MTLLQLILLEKRNLIISFDGQSCLNCNFSVMSSTNKKRGEKNTHMQMHPKI